MRPLQVARNMHSQQLEHCDTIHGRIAQADGWRWVLENQSISISFIFRPFTIMPVSVAWWTSSSTSDCILLTADLLRNSVIVVSSTYLCVKQRYVDDTTMILFCMITTLFACSRETWCYSSVFKHFLKFRKINEILSKLLAYHGLLIITAFFLKT